MGSAHPTTRSAVATSCNGWVRSRSPRRPQPCEGARKRLAVQAGASAGGRSGEPLHDPWKAEERRQTLLRYVQEVQPTSVVQFSEQTSPSVVQAMRQTVLNVVGSLPPQYFDVKISAVAESLAQLMLSIMTTGYMFRSAQFRLELQNSLKQLPAHSTATGSNLLASTTTSSTATTATVSAASAPAAGLAGAAHAAANVSADSQAPAASFLQLDSPEYAPGTQKTKVEGEVLRWHLERGVERVPARDYIEALEREVAALRQQLAAGAGSGRQQLPAASSFPPPIDLYPPTSASTGSVEVLGPLEPKWPGSKSGSSSGSGYGSGLQLGSWQTSSVSPLSNWGERARGSGGSASATAAPSMGSGGVPMVVGSPLGPSNELLDYLQDLQARSPLGLKELACSPSTSSGQAVKAAMEAFVARLMGSADPQVLACMNSEFTAVELSKVLFWLMAVGYTLKSLEARLEMEDPSGGSGGPSPNGGGKGDSSGGSPASGKGPGPGGNGGGKGGSGGKSGGSGGWGSKWLLPGW